MHALAPSAVGVEKYPPRQQRLGHWFAIIGLLLGASLLTGCSATRLAYNNAPDLLYWWSDGFFDWDQPQSTRLRNDLPDLLQWHRAQELPGVVATLHAVQTAALQDIQTDQVCALSVYVQQRLQAVLDRALPTAAAIAPNLSAAQLTHLELALDKRSREWREEWLDDPPAEREDRRLKKMVARAEEFYGRISPAQRDQLRAQLRASAFDPSLQFQEGVRRQQDILLTLRQITADAVSGTGTAAQTQAALRALVGRTLESPDPAFLQYTIQVRRQACAAVAEFHNRAGAGQRLRLQQTLQGYEADARALQAR
ncbi:MAG: DUF6279 family lipoprotein [Rhodoferax sp.]|nr:DUF6279 family lipoprotein [Rhodoferax sp.]